MFSDVILLSHIKLKPKRDWDWYRPQDKWDLVSVTKLCSKCNVEYTHKIYQEPMQKECCEQRRKKELIEAEKKVCNFYNWHQDYIWGLQQQESDCKTLNKETFNPKKY